jgi:hypothetical protein
VISKPQPMRCRRAQLLCNLPQLFAFQSVKEDTAMSTFLIPVTSGPDKLDLLRSVANPYHYATFGTQDGTIEARIDLIEEQGTEGDGFTVWGRLASSNLTGAFFTGTYNCQTRTGRFALKKAA